MMPDRSTQRQAQGFDSSADVASERAAATRTSQLFDRREQRSFRDEISRLAHLNARVNENGLITLLTSRAERRATLNASQPLLMPSLVWRGGVGIGMADVLLERLGATWHTYLPEEASKDRWAAELRDGLDSFARVAWCLRFGYTIAAVAIARKSFERWSFNIASSMQLATIENEPEADFFTRAWKASSNYVGERELGSEWSLMSELLHGRQVELAGQHVQIALDMQLTDQTRIHRAIAFFAEVSLRQVRGAVCRLAGERGHLKQNELSAALLPVEQLKGLPKQPDFLHLLWQPLLYGFVDADDTSTYIGWGASYRRIVNRRAEDRVGVGTFSDWMSIEERWVRAIERSRHSFQEEREVFGDAFSPLSLRARVTKYRIISEMTDILANEFRDTHRASALRSAAAALESAWVVWLQDVDDSLTLARSVLESTARARTHRLKPSRAAKMENGPQKQKAPHRWVDAAGWSRLSPFVRALSEYAHMQANSRHSGSWELLVKVQGLEVGGSADHTARGHALEKVAAMLAHEVADSLKIEWAALSEEFRHLVIEEDEASSQQNFERWLDATVALKTTHSFGSPDYR